LLSTILFAAVGGVLNCGSDGSRKPTTIPVGLGSLCWLDPPPEAATFFSEKEDSFGVRCFSVDMPQNILPEWAEIDKVSLCAKDSRITSATITQRGMTLARVEELEKWLEERWGPGAGNKVWRYTPVDGVDVTVSQSLKWKAATEDGGVVTRSLLMELCSQDISGGEVAASAPVYCGTLYMDYREDGWP